MNCSQVTQIHPSLGQLWMLSRSPSGCLPFLGEGSPKIDCRKKKEKNGYPHSNLSTGGPSQVQRFFSFFLLSPPRKRGHHPFLYFGESLCSFLRVGFGGFAAASEAFEDTCGLRDFLPFICRCCAADERHYSR